MLMLRCMKSSPNIARIIRQRRRKRAIIASLVCVHILQLSPHQSFIGMSGCETGLRTGGRMLLRALTKSIGSATSEWASKLSTCYATVYPHSSPTRIPRFAGPFHWKCVSVLLCGHCSLFMRQNKLIGRTFDDVTDATFKKIRSVCLHGGRIGTYPIHIWFISTYEWGLYPISKYPNACVFFLITLSASISDLCHIRAKNRNWVTLHWQCKCSLCEATQVWPLVNHLSVRNCDSNLS